MMSTVVTLDFPGVFINNTLSNSQSRGPMFGTNTDAIVAHILAQSQNDQLGASGGFKWLSVLESCPNNRLTHMLRFWHNKK